MKVMHTPVAHIFNLSVGGQEYSTIVQDVQYHPVTDRMLHVDFMQIIPEKPVTIGVPIKIIGTAPGVLRGGRLIKKMRKLIIKALVQNLPDDLTVSIDGLEIGDSVKVSDMKFENVILGASLSNINQMVRNIATGNPVLFNILSCSEIHFAVNLS